MSVDGSTEHEYNEVSTAMEPVPVKIVTTNDEAAEYASWRTYNFTGTEQPILILAQDARRSRAVILVAMNASFTGFFKVGALGDIQNGQGGRLGDQTYVEIKNQRELWITPDGVNGGIVTVLDERRN